MRASSRALGHKATCRQGTSLPGSGLQPASPPGTPRERGRDRPLGAVRSPGSKHVPHRPLDRRRPRRHGHSRLGMRRRNRRRQRGLLHSPGWRGRGGRGSPLASRPSTRLPAHGRALRPAAQLAQVHRAGRFNASQHLAAAAGLGPAPAAIAWGPHSDQLEMLQDIPVLETPLTPGHCHAGGGGMARWMWLREGEGGPGSIDPSIGRGRQAGQRQA